MQRRGGQRATAKRGQDGSQRDRPGGDVNKRKLLQWHLEHGERCNRIVTARLFWNSRELHATEIKVQATGRIVAFRGSYGPIRAEGRCLNDSVDYRMWPMPGTFQVMVCYMRRTRRNSLNCVLGDLEKVDNFAHQVPKAIPLDSVQDERPGWPPYPVLCLLLVKTNRLNEPTTNLVDGKVGLSQKRCYLVGVLTDVALIKLNLSSGRQRWVISSPR